MAYTLSPYIRKAIKAFAEGRHITMNNKYHLRCLTMAQSAELHEILKDRSISKWIAKFAYGYKPDEAITWCRRAEISASEGSELFLGLFDSISNKLIAIAGITPETEEDGSVRAEIGYVVAKEYHGRGFPVKLLNAVVDLAFKELGIARIYSTSATGNLANQYVLKRVGLEHKGNIIVETNGFSPRVSALYEQSNPLMI